MKDPAENRLVMALRSADPAEFESGFRAAYAEHRAVVYGLLVRLCGDTHTAADLFQNVWLKLSRYRCQLRPDTELRAWLCTVARREFLSYRRAQLIDPGRLLAWGREPEPTTHGSSDLRGLQAALDQLSEGDREALLLTSVEGLDGAGAASALGISEPALRQRLSRARRRLAAALESASQPEHELLSPLAPKREGGNKP